MGIKVWPRQVAQPGAIIIRQRGAKFTPGTNCGMGKDHTIYSTAHGYVQLTRVPENRKRHVESVVDKYF